MMTNLDTIKQLRSVLADIHKANGLPNPCYTDAEFFQVERQAIFARNWTAIAFDNDTPSSGFAYPINFMGLPLILVRDPGWRFAGISQRLLAPWHATGE